MADSNERKRCGSTFLWPALQKFILASRTLLSQYHQQGRMMISKGWEKSRWRMATGDCLTVVLPKEYIRSRLPATNNTGSFLIQQTQRKDCFGSRSKHQL